MRVDDFINVEDLRKLKPIETFEINLEDWRYAVVARDDSGNYLTLSKGTRDDLIPFKSYRRTLKNMEKIIEQIRAWYYKWES